MEKPLKLEHIGDIMQTVHSVIPHYATCPTAAATTAKEITTSSGRFLLVVGARITVKFSYTNSANNPTFNVNGTGAKPVWYNTAQITTASKGYAGTANRLMEFVYDGSYWVFVGWSYDANSDTIPSAYCTTAAATAAKIASMTYFAATAKSRFNINFRYGNTVQGTLTLNVNSTGAKPVYINGAASSASNYTLPAGSYTAYYDGTNYYLRTDGTLTGDITGNAATVSDISGHIRIQGTKLIIE